MVVMTMAMIVRAMIAKTMFRGSSARGEKQRLDPPRSARVATAGRDYQQCLLAEVDAEALDDGNSFARDPAR
jgi:hypothetical protein